METKVNSLKDQVVTLLGQIQVRNTLSIIIGFLFFFALVLLIVASL